MTARGKGLKIYVGDGEDPEVFTQITGAHEIQLPARSWDTEETQGHDSTDPVKTFATTVRDDGALNLTILSFDSANDEHALIEELSTTGEERNFRFVHPGSALGSSTFSGIVTNFSLETPVNGLQKGHFTFKANGTVGNDAPTISSLTITDSQAGAYVTAEACTLRATFNEIVKVTGTPRIAITLASGTVFATYASGTGTNKLNFSKTFGGGDQADATEFDLVSPIQLNSGTIKDMSGNPAVLAFTGPNTDAFTVNP